MLYHSTNNNQHTARLEQAVAKGLAPDGGLYVPDSLPRLPKAFLRNMSAMTLQEMAYAIAAFALKGDVPEDVLHDIVYSAFDFEIPLVKTASGNYVLELFHGPTMAFKDVGTRFMALLLNYYRTRHPEWKTLNILVPTSGDTGSAVANSFWGMPGVRVYVLYPRDAVNKIQKSQFATLGGNVTAIEVNGTFDDCKSLVEKAFMDLELNSLMRLTSAMSINYARLVPQMIYYFWAYTQLMRQQKVGDLVFAVPCSNLGNLTSGLMAHQMGLPVKRFICASNSNNVLTDFIRTGVYNKNRDFYTTVSPSMDILVSSNLERLLYCMSGCNDAETKGYMDLLKSEGVYTVSTKIKEKLQSMFWGGYADEDATKRTIHDLFEQQGYLCDTHTAVAVSVCDAYIRESGDPTPVVIASTASPYKFSKAVLSALDKGKMPESEFDMVEQLHEITGAEVPAPLASLKGKKARFGDVTDKEDMQSVVFGALGIK
jgi:threonine synthase